jgi:4-aminobutyrate aminotransferase-like enzyme
MLCGQGITIDDDLPVRSVISDAAAMIAALVAGGLEQSGDGRFRAAVRLLTPLATSRSSCRAAHTS